MLLAGCSSGDSGPDATAGEATDGSSLEQGATESTSPGTDGGDSGGTLAAPSCNLGPAPPEDDPEVAASPVEFDVEGDLAVMSGTIGADFVHRVCDLTAENPGVVEIEMFDVPGSSTPGDETLEGGLVLRAQGLDTYLPGDGQVESGGVDFFLAGQERIVEDGGCLGVHSTEIDYGDGPVSAADLPPDHPEHQPFLEYFDAIGIPEDFYWFTLEAAPPAGIHYLTPEEMERFEVVTGPVPSQRCVLPDEG